MSDRNAPAAGTLGEDVTSIVAVNTLPCPTSLESVSVPPIASTMRRQIASPNPVPPNFRVTELSAWTNGSKIAVPFLLGDANARIDHVEDEE